MPDERFFCLHSDLCKALANPKRQMILSAMRDGETTVGELSETTGIPQATLSQHLALLRSRSVVDTRRDGNFVYYWIAYPKILEAFDLITEVMLEMSARQRDAMSTCVLDQEPTAKNTP